MKKKVYVLLFAVLSMTAAFSQVEWYVSTQKLPWQKGNGPVLQTYNGSRQNLLEILLSEKKQAIDGWGGCFNERGMEELSVLPEEKKKEVIAQLFDSVDGCGFNICRMPIGASDYAMDAYSLDDTPGDYRMEHFTIDRDRKYLIPYIKLAMQYNPSLKIWGSPWSPPAWMKANNHYACQGMKDSSHLRWDRGTQTAYAGYLAKYVEAYRHEGIHVYAVHVQNEPYACQNFPSCLWTGAQMRDFIRDYLGPRFKELNAEIWLGTINNGNYDDCAGVVLSDPEAAKYIKGVGYQWSGKNAIVVTAARHPDKRLMQTESECGGGENNMQAALYTYSLINHYLKSGANSYMYWNMVLDRSLGHSSGLSTWGWPQNSLISIDRNTLEVSYNMEFYVMKHFAHFIKEGAYRVTTSGYDKNVLAFVNPDNKLVVVIGNDSQFSESYTIKIADQMFQAEVPAFSFNTFVISR
jgi:glucosylceramidase